MRKNRVCILTPNQALQFERNGTLPNCAEHRHLSRRVADRLVEDRLVFRDDRGDYIRYVEARWVGRGKRFITFVRSREWKRMDSAGTTTMQLVPAGGAW